MDSAGKANYGFEVLVTGNGRLQGNLTYHDPGANEDVQSHFHHRVDR